MFHVKNACEYTCIGATINGGMNSGHIVRTELGFIIKIKCSFNYLY